MSWLLIAVAVWTAVALAVGLLIGRSIRLADERDPRRELLVVPDFVPSDWVAPTAEAT